VAIWARWAPVERMVEESPVATVAWATVAPAKVDTPGRYVDWLLPGGEQHRECRRKACDT
jgi:hypothetical protein